MAGPAPGVEHQRQRLLGVVIDEASLFRETQFLHQREAAEGAALLVPMGGMDKDRKIEFLR